MQRCDFPGNLSSMSTVDTRNGTAAMVRFSPEVGAALVAKARREGRHINDVIRQAVGELVVAREAVEHPPAQVRPPAKAPPP